MNKWIFAGIGFAGGCALGAGVAYLVLRKRFQQELEERIDIEAEALRLNCPSNLRAEPETVEAPAVEEDKGEAPVVGVAKVEREQPTSYDRAYVPSEDKPDLDVLVSKYGGIEFRDDYDVDENGEDYPRESDPEDPNEEDEDEEDEDPYFTDPVYRNAVDYKQQPEPFLIDEDMYVNDLPNYDKVAMTFWRGDETFSNESEEMVDNARELLGDEFWGRLMAGEFEGTICIRNHKEMRDICLAVTKAAYSEYILGIDSTEYEGPKVERIPKRRKGAE